MANFASASDTTNDAYSRGKVTINLISATPNYAANTTTISWSLVVSDGSSYGGFNYNNPSGSGAYASATLTASNGGTISGTSSANTGYQSYDFGSGVVSSPYFPRTVGTYSATVTHRSSDGVASIGANAVLQGNANPLGYASATIAATALTDFNGPATQADPTVSRVSGTPTSISITAQAPSNFGSASLLRYEYDYSTIDFVTDTPANLVSMGTSLTATKTGLTSTQGYYVRTRTVTGNNVAAWQTSAWSNSVFIAGVPSAPAAPTISNVVTTNLTLSWTAPSSNGATISSYTIQATTDNGANWSNLYTGVTTTTQDVTGLTIAATYKFRIVAINSSGTSTDGTASGAQFISAYGYRFTSPTAKTAVVSAARYTGSQSDSIVLNGVTYTGWKQIANVKKYINGIWGPLER